MLQIKNIRKEYVTGDLTQTALDDVSLNFRDNEFVAILGPSGSGKTTLLNIIGGLDRYDSGDLIINGISTRQYKDKDWDSYRNHTIGFVFQSYNLIPHQTVLANVELALTISGISKAERRKRAKEALQKVGLGNQLHKKPNQMSGGQMQRVAIARALVNNPAILLADEPTGALDSETSVQVMDMLQEVAKDRLVIMVTHNPELAYEYATRIVRVKDGKILEDTQPLEEVDKAEAHHENMGKSSMSLFTSMGLSFNNLKTKKGRTLLTSFAGSIGIIGIALILSLSNGVNNYIDDLQKDTMTSYPISIEAQSMDFASIMLSGRSKTEEKLSEADHKLDGVYSDGSNLEMASTFQTSIKKNNLTDFKQYLDDPESEIHNYIGENGIVFNYDTKFSVYTYDEDDTLVNTDGSTLSESTGNSRMDAMMKMALNSSMMASMPASSNNFEELMPGTNGSLISPTITDNYDLIYGSMPDSYDELVLVLDKQNEIPLTVLYQLGFLPSKEYKDLLSQMNDGDEIKLDSKKISYADICRQKFYLVPVCDMYHKNTEGLYEQLDSDSSEFKQMLENALELKITGVIRQKKVDNALINSAVGYTSALTEYLIDYTDKSDVVRAQEKDEDTNILNGLHFDAKSDKEKIADAKNYISELGVSEKAAMYQSIMMMEQFLNQDKTEETTEATEGIKNMSHRNQPVTISPLVYHQASIMPLADWEEISDSEITDATETEFIEESTEEIPSSEIDPTEPTEEITDAEPLPVTELTEEITQESETLASETETTEEATTAESTESTEPTTEAIFPTDAPDLPDSLTPEMVMQYLENLKNNISAEIETQKQNASDAVDAGLETVEDIRQSISALNRTLQAIASITESADANFSGLTPESLMKMLFEQMGGASSASPTDLMSIFSSASGMQDLLNQGGSSMQDLMSMYTAASGMQDLLSGYGSQSGGLSAQDMMSAYLSSAGGGSQQDLMSAFLNQGTALPSSSGTSMQDMLAAYTSASGMSQEDLMKMYMNQQGATPSGMNMQDMMKMYAEQSGMSQEDMMKMYAEQTGMSQEELEKMMSLSSKSETELAALMDDYMNDPDDDIMLSIYERYISSGTYDENMTAFGVVSLDAPTSINIYVDSFEAKEGVADCIKAYNESVSEENQISYTDYVGLLMSSVTTIVNVISYVLIAFVAVSLIVSSIMIGIITYISVLERTKEIGILRAIGASKQNISQVFNAETFIIGLCSGLIGVGMTGLILIPGNMVIHALTDSTDVNAVLPAASAAVLVLISVILTLIGGLIPAKKAASKDPVTALRTE